MNTEIKQFYIEAAQNPASENIPTSLKDEAEQERLFRELLSVDEFDMDTALKKIRETYMEYAAPSFRAMETKIQERETIQAETLKGLATYDKQKQDLERAIDNLQKIIDTAEELKSLLPQKVQSSMAQEVQTPTHPPLKFINLVKQRLNWFERLRFDSKPIQEKYEQLRAMLAKPFRTRVPNEQETSELRTKIELIDKGKESYLKSQNEKIKQLDETIQSYKDEIAEYNTPMNITIGRFLVAMTDKQYLNKIEQITPFADIQNLTEPVAFFQRINDDERQQKTIDLLRKLGLTVSAYYTDDPETYIVRKGEYIDSSFLELITPFYSPEKARKNITALAKYLARNGVDIEGLIHPTTYKQLDPRIDEAAPKYTDAGDILHILQKKLKYAEETKDFCDSFGDHSTEYLFRGHNFITPDPMSSYATVTTRPGRTGIPYATDNVAYALTYTGGRDTKSMAGGTWAPRNLCVGGEIIPVGFLTMYKRSPKNLLLTDQDLEGRHTLTGHELKDSVKKAQEAYQNETPVNPRDNPVVARYCVSGDKIIKIDDTDSEWQTLMKYFVPDLDQTYAPGFMHRLDALRADAAAHDGTVTTYDLTEEQLEQMRMKRDQFEAAKRKLIPEYEQFEAAAKQKLIDKYKPKPVQSPQMDAHRD